MEVVQKHCSFISSLLGGGASALRMFGEESLLKVCVSEVLAAGNTTMSSSLTCSGWLSMWSLSPGGVVVECRSSDVT